MSRFARACALAALVGLGACGEAQYEDVEVGFRGLAARNPYLGAQRLAEHLGYEGFGTSTLTHL
ncbi:MAG: hypothetical protein KDB61_15900, partial [Planctomycetes bacterium]|nr:hypothetical protein [Planctomycetota bacterium]